MRSAAPYGRTITCIGLLLLISHFLLSSRAWLAIGVAALACGIQNSIASRFRGLVLRTTHLTGLITDLGVNIGLKPRGHDIPLWKVMVPASIAVSFFCGALFGTYAALTLHAPLLLATGLSYCIGGIAWSALKRTRFLGADTAPES